MTTNAVVDDWHPWKLTTGKVSPVVEQLEDRQMFRCRICHKKSDSAGGTSKHATKLHGRAAVDALIYDDSVTAVAATAAVAEPAAAAAVAAEAASVTTARHAAEVAQSANVDSAGVLDLIRSDLVAELVTERARNKRLHENLVAIRDLITELLDV